MPGTACRATSRSSSRRSSNPRWRAREQGSRSPRHASASRDAYDVRVLEPSPPAVTRRTVQRRSDGARRRGRRAHARRAGRDRRRGRPHLGRARARRRGARGMVRGARARRVGNRRRRSPTSMRTRRTRTSMHALAEHVLCAARHAANGKIGLRFTRRGFGTPFFGADEQVRVEGTNLVRRRRRGARRDDDQHAARRGEFARRRAGRARPLPRVDTARSRRAARRSRPKASR